MAFSELDEHPDDESYQKESSPSLEECLDTGRFHHRTDSQKNKCFHSTHSTAPRYAEETNEEEEDASQDASSWLLMKTFVT